MTPEEMDLIYEGYITRKENDANIFLLALRAFKNNEKISVNDYALEDIRTVCMSFLKKKNKKIYLVDEENYIMNNLSLKPIEKKLFFKSVKVVNSKRAIK